MVTESKKVCSCCGKEIKIDDVFEIQVTALGLIYTCVSCYVHYAKSSSNEPENVLTTLGIIDQL